MPGSGGLPLLLGEGYTDRHGETSHTVESRSNEMPVYDCWGGRDGWWLAPSVYGLDNACRRVGH